jgi:hypothetical protein
MDRSDHNPKRYQNKRVPEWKLNQTMQGYSDKNQTQKADLRFIPMIDAADFKPIPITNDDEQRNWPAQFRREIEYDIVGIIREFSGWKQVCDFDLIRTKLKPADAKPRVQ